MTKGDQGIAPGDFGRAANCAKAGQEGHGRCHRPYGEGGAKWTAARPEGEAPGCCCSTSWRSYYCSTFGLRMSLAELELYYCWSHFVVQHQQAVCRLLFCLEFRVWPPLQNFGAPRSLVPFACTWLFRSRSSPKITSPRTRPQCISFVRARYQQIPCTVLLVLPWGSFLASPSHRAQPPTAGTCSSEHGATSKRPTRSR